MASTYIEEIDLSKFIGLSKTEMVLLRVKQMQEQQERAQEIKEKKQLLVDRNIKTSAKEKMKLEIRSNQL